MTITSFRGLLLGAVLSAGLGAAPVAAQSPPPCDQQLAGLDRRIEAVRGNLSPPASRAELEALDAHRRALEMVAKNGTPQACAAVLNDSIAVVQAVESPRVLPADEFDDRKLRNPQGEELGEIGELIVDPVRGQIVYAVVELGGFLGLGERYFPVPWSLVRPAPDGDAFVLNVAKERLTAAPQFARDNRPNMADRQWAQALHTYYGVVPPWLESSAVLGALVSSGAGSQTAGDAQEIERLKAEVSRLNEELMRMRASGGSGAPPVPGAAGNSGDSPQPQAAPQSGNP
ncbi:PRC-barrel domain-containing protein [Azospirillum sp. RWY-5-1]|uniref:PRC-barrel domain-containing protein n=1 Tax=Azospirillum oleiclasticum TaxID=2735135 RepID=A0ABX2TES8_9PROT|nr:PRC-barrel domain-containing protein [Azospirillum oleiclasticum]NYZ14934.1 PRC-barrel domain-containing protein [Azospirillum oleiclasticum]NYZ22696.1 PRC-barrel domain-containing protein [Azospirillum oleiclasticum]